MNKMNKKGFAFKNGMFALVAVSILVVAFATIVSEQSSYYNTNATTSVEQYNRLSSISNTSGTYRSQLTPEDAEPGSDAEASTFRGVYGIMAGMFGVFDVLLGSDGMLNSLVVQFGLPDYIRQGIITFVLIAIAMSLAAVIFRLARREA